MYIFLFSYQLYIIFINILNYIKGSPNLIESIQHSYFIRIIFNISYWNFRLNHTELMYNFVFMDKQMYQNYTFAIYQNNLILIIKSV